MPFPSPGGLPDPGIEHGSPSCITGGFFTICCCCSVAKLQRTPWTAAHQASLSLTLSQSLPKLMSIESVMPSNHLILCRPLLLSSIFLSIRVFSNELALPIRSPEYWSFSFSISPSNVQGWFPLDGLVGSPCSPRDSQESSPTPQFKSINSSVLSFFMVQLSHPYMTTGKMVSSGIYTPFLSALVQGCSWEA